ncbi:MAG: sodium/glutamate symporter [Pseudomonadota bacterium]
MGDTFHGVIAFAFLAALILIGVALRARIRILQNSLLPASLIGGLLGFVLISLDLSFGFESSDYVAFAFHFFTLSFMSLVLTGKESGAPTQSVGNGALWLSVGWTMSLVLQALVGLAVIVTYNAVTGGSLSNYLGMLVTHGFTQGPGQALAMGNIWQSEFEVNLAVDFGLIYASMGFILSFLIGVPAARYAIQRGLNANTESKLTAVFLKGWHEQGERPVAGYQVSHSANVDSLVVHLGVLGLAYFITHQYLLLLQQTVAGVTLFGLPIEILASHNLFFIHGLIVCLIIRKLMDRLGFGHVIDNETQKRITGSSVDLMMAATIMSIQFTLLAEYIVPILAVCLAAALTTALLCFGFGRFLNHLSAERAITLFGCCTGSTGSGLLLLRILDPDLSTPVPRELAFFNVAIIFLTLHILMVMAPLLPSFGLLTVCLVYGGTFVVGAIAMQFLAKRS